MKLRSITNRDIPRRRRCAAMQLIECIVYIGVLLVIMNVSGLALFRVLDYLRSLRYQSDQVTSALTAGERWRADVRFAGAPGELIETNGTAELHLPGANGTVAYVWWQGAVLRRAHPNAAWQPVLSAVSATRFVREDRAGVPVWRWELALEPRRLDRRPPLQFTFQAVPDEREQP